VGHVAAPYDPRPTADRSTGDVAITRVHTGNIEQFEQHLRASVARAIDTETVYNPLGFDAGPGPLRVVSAATRAADGTERAWVIDIHDIDRSALAAALTGVTADAWNADFDSRVIDRDIVEPARTQGYDVEPPRWWDAQLADALIHQGISGFGFYHGLAWAAEWYLGIHAQGKGTTQLSYTEHDPLTDEQIAYAAADAVETLWVADAIRERINAEGLERVCELEQRARPFLDHMERAGLPFDWEGWQAQLDDMGARLDRVMGELAERTGGGQGTLFSEHLEPSWNPGSERQTKLALNEWAADRVHDWAARTHGERRGLLPTDSLGATVLAEIGGDLCQLLLEHRDLTKTLTTYGEVIREHLHADGRLRPEYLQVVGTNTGRLASRNPNAQNLTPKMKPHIRPADPDRTFVYADLSQAELRFVTQVAGDINLRQAFIDGADVHVSTAERMFGVDMGALRASDDEAYDQYRAKAKRINFGIVYGQRGAGLARSLSQSGVETSREEGTQLLDSYLGAYPHIAAWVGERDRFIDALAEGLPAMDWPLTLELHRMWPLVRAVRRAFRDEAGRWPTAEEVHEHMDETLSLDEVAWTLSFNAPIALQLDGTAFGFASHTLAGRRQQFTIHTESLLAGAASTAARSTKPGPARVRRRLTDRLSTRFEDDTGELLSPPAADKLLEDRALRRAVVDEIVNTMGAAAAANVLDRTLRERVGRMGNAYRNAPIQGGVADVMLEAYGLLYERLTADHPTAQGVQTVHDSVVVECDIAEAPAVALTVKRTLEEAMARWCPDVPAVADTDIRRSLSDSDVETVLANPVLADSQPALSSNR
jgi:DNA polymerase I-like protein with 3'-5' exonuclease and polymerase domains